MNKRTEKKLDKDTRELLTAQEKIKSLTEHEGWPIVRERFLNIAATKLNMSQLNLTTVNGEQLLRQIMVGREVAAELLSILNEIQGTAEQYDANQALTEQIDKGYVVRPAPIR